MLCQGSPQEMTLLKCKRGESLSDSELQKEIAVEAHREI
jgi:hypothetical protein